MMSGAAAVICRRAGGAHASARPVAEKLLGAPADKPARIRSGRYAHVDLGDLRQLAGEATAPIDVAARLIAEDGRDAFVSRDVLTNGEGALANGPASATLAASR